MAETASARSIAALRVPNERTDDLTVISGGRGSPDRIGLTVNDALAPCLEGIALADEAIAAVERISVALANGSKYAVQHEANRLRDIAMACRTELRRMAGVLDGGRAA